jgi:hypothetical protein
MLQVQFATWLVLVQVKNKHKRSLLLRPPCVEKTEEPICRPERGEWTGAEKILVEGDDHSNKMNTASKTRLWLNYPSWPRPRSHWSATGPRNQQPPKPTPRMQQNKQLKQLLTTPVTPVLARSSGLSRRNTRHPPETHRATLDLEPCHPSRTWWFPLKGHAPVKPVQLTQSNHYEPRNPNSKKPTSWAPKLSKPETAETQDNREHNKTFTWDKTNKGSALVWPVTGTSQISQAWAARDEQQPPGQLPQIQLLISRFAPRIHTRHWG